MTLAQLFDLAFGNIGRFFKEIAFKKEERGKLSYGFVGTLILVLTYGLIMLFSASYSTGYYRFKGDIYHFIRPQVILAVVGLVLMYLISNINYRSLRHMNWYLYILTLLLLVWALFSEPYNGCYRWVYMFGTTLQPSELAKFSAILGLACFADRYYEKRGTLLYGIVLPVLPLLPVVVLLYKEPHNSAIMLILLIAGSMILCGGVGRFWCIPAAGAAVFVIYKMLTGQNNYVQQRLGAWNGDEGDILYQTQQSLYSIASGGLTGLGIGNSRQKHLWLPEASNDFIFSVLCEELGFIGAVICMGLFAALIIQGVIIALNSPDYFGTMLGIGIMSQIAWQAMIHIAVVTNVAPNHLDVHKDMAEDIAAKVSEHTKAIVIINPNNPTGMLIPHRLLKRILEKCRKLDILLVVDECFLDFVKEPEEYSLKRSLSGFNNLFILKAFTKRYAMAGVRLGYGLCSDRKLLERMELCVQPWNVSTMAQAAGLQALTETEYVEEGRQLVFREAQWLKDELARIGYKVFPSEANYIFFKGPENLFEKCVEHGILIRDCSNYSGLRKGYYRVAVKLHEQNEKLIEILEEVLS
mgnify:CR=1 FL=1